MRTLLLAAPLAGITLLALGGPITSQTFIDAGKQFVLGGQQVGAFQVVAHNIGPVAVSIAARQANGLVQERGRLEPGQRLTLSFEAGSAAVVRNLGQRQAVLSFRITGSAAGLGMVYETLKK